MIFLHLDQKESQFTEVYYVAGLHSDLHHNKNFCLLRCFSEVYGVL